MKKFVASVLIVSLLSSCATHPESVAPIHVSSTKYKDVSCEAIAGELASIDTKTATVSATLNKAANNDVALVVGSLILWPLLLGVAATGGKAEEAELARLKGERIALTEAALEKKCNK